MDDKKIIKVLLEKIAALEAENELLHSQVDVIEVTMTDKEAKAILTSVKRAKSLAYEEEMQEILEEFKADSESDKDSSDLRYQNTEVDEYDKEILAAFKEYPVEGANDDC